MKHSHPDLTLPSSDGRVGVNLIPPRDQIDVNPAIRGGQLQVRVGTLQRRIVRESFDPDASGKVSTPIGPIKFQHRFAWVTFNSESPGGVALSGKFQLRFARESPNPDSSGKVWGRPTPQCSATCHTLHSSNQPLVTHSNLQVCRLILRPFRALDPAKAGL